MSRGATLLAAAALLLGGSGALAVSAAGAAPSPQSINGSGAGSLACSASPGDWTDCTITLSQPVLPGGTVQVSLPDGTDSNLVCENRPSATGAYCGTDPDLVQYQFPDGGMAGDQLTFGDYGQASPGQAPAASVSIIAPTTGS